jgi:hypothetical protein
MDLNHLEDKQKLLVIGGEQVIDGIYNFWLG